MFWLGLKEQQQESGKRLRGSDAAAALSCSAEALYASGNRAMAVDMLPLKLYSCEGALCLLSNDFINMPLWFPWLVLQYDH
jgi:hypothetical protein